MGGRVVVVEHEFDELAFRQHRREPCDGDVEGLEVSLPGAGEHRPALLVDGARDPIREMGKFALAVVGRRRADHVDVNGPTVFEWGERLVDPEGHHFLVPFAGAFGVRARVAPSGHERAVLVDDHAVVHDGGVVEQIHEAVAGLTVRSQGLHPKGREAAYSLLSDLNGVECAG